MNSSQQGRRDYYLSVRQLSNHMDNSNSKEMELLHRSLLRGASDFQFYQFEQMKYQYNPWDEF